MRSKAQSILEQIKRRQRQKDLEEYLFGPPPNYNEFDIDPTPLTADAWQEFKRKFVEEYGGEKVQPTGMTHSEFLNYIDTSGYREGDEFMKSRKLRDILRGMDCDD